MELAGSGATWTGSPKGGFSGRKHHKPPSHLKQNSRFRRGCKTSGWVGFIDWLGVLVSGVRILGRWREKRVDENDSPPTVPLLSFPYYTKV